MRFANHSFFYSHSIPTFFGTGVVDHILVTLCLLLQFFKCVHFALVIILKSMWVEQIVRLGICCVDWQVCQVRVTHQLHPNHLSTKLDFLVLITGRSASIMLLQTRQEVMWKDSPHRDYTEYKVYHWNSLIIGI